MHELPHAFPFTQWGPFTIMTAGAGLFTTTAAGAGATTTAHFMNRWVTGSLQTAAMAFEPIAKTAMVARMKVRMCISPELSPATLAPLRSARKTVVATNHQGGVPAIDSFTGRGEGSARVTASSTGAIIQGVDVDIQEIVAGIASSDAIKSAAASVGVDPNQAQSILHGILEHVDGGGGIEGIVESVAGKTGIDPETVQSFLPQVMPLLQGHAANASEGVQGVLGSLVGSLGGMLGGSGGGDAIGALEGLAGGLFGHKG
jgi:hypothetical protein